VFLITNTDQDESVRNELPCWVDHWAVLRFWDPPMLFWLPC